MELLVFYLLISIGVSFSCSILEAVLLSSTNSYIEIAGKENDKFGKIAKDIKFNIDKSISSILVANTFAHTLGAAGVGAQAAKLYGDEWQVFIAVLLTLLILYVSEILPKVIGATYWKKIIIPSFYTIYYLSKVVYPFVLASLFITKIIRKDAKDQVSREEILAIAEMGEKQGSIQSKEGDLIENLLKLRNYRAKDILTPRSVVFAFEASTKIAEAIEEDRMYLHSRIPVYKDSLDNVVGLVFNQTILEESIEGNHEIDLESIAVPLYMVSENVPVLMLIDLFVKRKEHLFLVHDSYGQTSGIVSLEDAIETLLGVEIVDEMDEVADMQQHAKEKAKFLKIKLEKSNRESKAKKEKEEIERELKNRDNTKEFGG